METTIIKIGGMSCQACVKNVNQVLGALPGVSSVATVLERGEATVVFDPEILARAALVERVDAAGFDAA